MRQRHLPTLATIALLLACAEDSLAPGVNPVNDAQLNADVATVAADAAAQDVELMRGPSVGPFGLGLIYRAGAFDCNTHTRPGLTVTRTCTYKDAAGSVQSAYDPIATASVNLKTTVKGDIVRDKWSAKTDRSSDFTATGLAGNETQATWNGAFNAKTIRVRITDDGTTRSYEITATGTVTNVVIPVPRTPTSWPTSGTITKNVTATKADGSTVTRTVTIVFNGTNIAKVTINGETMDFDLSQRGRAKRGP
jgi:hypothetical protein